MVFPRHKYLDKLHRHKNTDFVKVVTGIRRVGKSTILRLFSEQLLQEGVSPKQIVQINLDEIKHEHLCEYHALHEYILEQIGGEHPTKQHYVFIDEIQNCPDFQKAIRSLYTTKCADFYISGSNAYILSGELSTLLSGRYVEVEVFPLSFSEFTEAFPQKSKEVLFHEYMQIGGFPVIACLETGEEQKAEELSAILNSITMKDILLRNPAFSAPLLQKIIRFLASNLGSPISTKNMANTLLSAGEKVSLTKIEQYLEALCLCYFFQSANNFDVTGKQILRDNHKFYMIDLAFRTLLVHSSRDDYGHMLENVVFLELRRRGYQVSVGSTWGYEVDFVAQRYAETLYVQVSASVENPTTLERELRSLRQISSEGEKLLLCMERSEMQYDDISQQNIIDWLQNGTN